MEVRKAFVSGFLACQKEPCKNMTAVSFWVFWQDGFLSWLSGALIQHHTVRVLQGRTGAPVSLTEAMTESLFAFILFPEI